jgi:hypothetical protein
MEAESDKGQNPGGHDKNDFEGLRPLSEKRQGCKDLKVSFKPSYEGAAPRGSSFFYVRMFLFPEKETPFYTGSAGEAAVFIL